MYGSHRTGLGMPWSDIDLGLRSSKPDCIPQDVLHDVFMLMRRSLMVTDRAVRHVQPGQTHFPGQGARGQARGDGAVRVQKGGHHHDGPEPQRAEVRGHSSGVPGEVPCAAAAVPGLEGNPLPGALERPFAGKVLGTNPRAG